MRLRDFFQRKPVPKPLYLAAPSSVIHPEAKFTNCKGYPESIQIGAGSHVRGHLVTFPDGGSIKLGAECYVGEDTRIWSRHSVTIGDHVLISHMVDIHDTDGHPVDWQLRRQDTRRIFQALGADAIGEIAGAPVVIKDDAWIGFKASILKGVTIGRGAVVAAGSVVTRSVEDFTLVAGVPAQVIKKLPERSEP